MTNQLTHLLTKAANAGTFTQPAFTSVVSREAIWTGCLAAALVVVTWSATWLVSRHESLETRRFWRMTFRHLGAIAFVVGLILIWRHQLQNGVVALGAALAGLLVTLRENWLSLCAFWVRVGRRHYGLDDFIEIDGVRGRVLNVTWLSTVVAEVGPGRDGLSYSGRVVNIPNYRTLLAPLYVENLTGEYSAHMLNVLLPAGTDVLKAESLLLEAAMNVCGPFLADAALHMLRVQLEQAMDTPSVEPKVLMHIGDYGLVTLSVRIVAKAGEKQNLEQAILREFFARSGEAHWPGQPVHSLPSARRCTRKSR